MEEEEAFVAVEECAVEECVSGRVCSVQWKSVSVEECVSGRSGRVSCGRQRQQRRGWGVGVLSRPGTQACNRVHGMSPLKHFNRTNTNKKTTLTHSNQASSEQDLWKARTPHRTHSPQLFPSPTANTTHLL